MSERDGSIRVLESVEGGELEYACTEALAYSIQYMFIYQGGWIVNLVM